MNINLAIAKMPLVDANGAKSLPDLCLFKENFPWVRKTGGRVDFHIYFNKYTLTKTGYITIYISYTISDTITSLSQIIKDLMKAIQKFNTKKMYVLLYKFTNIQLSGKLILLARLY